MLKSGRHALIFFLLFTIAMVVVGLILNPLLRTEAGVRRCLINIMPIGSSMEDVTFAVAANDSWTIRSMGAGISLHPQRLTPTRGVGGDSRFPVVGSRSVEVHLGTYRHITRVDVTAFFAFDGNGDLIEIFVVKDFDLL